MVLVLLALFVATFAAAQTFPKLTGRVVDEAHLLRPEQVMDISSKSAALEAQSGGRQLVVATVPDLQGQVISDYAYNLGRAWGIGQKGKDDGVILLVAPKERKVWIATGYGAGAYMTDAVSGEIIREKILPRFRAGDMGGGIVDGATEIARVMSLPPDQAQAQAAQAGQRSASRNQESAGLMPVLFWIFIILFVIIPLVRRLGGRRYRRGGGWGGPIILWGPGTGGSSSSTWGGGSSWGSGGGFGGGGGFSGGGGSFGGGGAGGSW
ncbi:TPM domain-containing protein [Sphingomonas ginkgonis]|uniref:TPM domain-containing protein n=1 Tax=Sphingomonas ginkgonis TaxID=2315330 RepID=A0A3R9Z8G1_9SPHN|nr:TPM domain-containing protein [Sphingomonas ginkgonis]RST32272.1 TPM domain-containing protein [Sphingomonas ginkgonis]